VRQRILAAVDKPRLGPRLAVDVPFDNLAAAGTFKGRGLPMVVVGNRKVDPDREYTPAVTDISAANQATAENLRTTGLLWRRPGSRPRTGSAPRCILNL
jgi:hypothetical protein